MQASSFFTLKRSLSTNASQRAKILLQKDKQFYNRYQQSQQYLRFVQTFSQSTTNDDNDENNRRRSDNSMQRYSSTTAAAVSPSDERSSVIENSLESEHFRSNDNEVTAAHLERFMALMSEHLENENDSKTNSQQKAQNIEPHLESSKESKQQEPSISELMENFDAQSPPSRDDLHALQLWYECESYRDTMLEAEEGLASARERHDYANIGKVKKHLLQWYTPLKAAIEAEQLAIMNGEHGMESRKGYGPYLLALRADKLAIIVSHETIGSLIRVGGGAYDYGKQLSSKTRTNRGGGLILVRAALDIGDAIEAEVAVERALFKNAEKRKKKYGKSSTSSNNEVVSESSVDEEGAENIDENITKLRQIGKPYSESAFEENFSTTQKGGRQKRNVFKAKAKKILMTDNDWPSNSK